MNEILTPDKRRITELLTFINLFVDKAVKYSIDMVYRTGDMKMHGYPLLFKNDVIKARRLYDDFAVSLERELTALNHEGRWAYERNLKGGFFPIIEHYFQWYGDNKKATEVFGAYNPYEDMFNIIGFTKREIFNYFPENTNQNNYGDTLPAITETLVPVNPHPEIFKNYYAFEMFLELKKLTVKPNSIVADYSFIFHKMKNKDIKAINMSVTEPIFIEFLNTTQDTDISVDKLPFRAPKYKEPIYSTVLDKFKELI